MDQDELVERSKRAVRKIVARLRHAGGPPSPEQVREALQAALSAEAPELGGLRAIVLGYVHQAEARDEELEDLAEVARLWSTGRLSSPAMEEGTDTHRRRQSAAGLLDRLRVEEPGLETRLAELPRSWAAVEALCEAARESAPETAALLSAMAVVIARELPRGSAVPNLLAFALAHQASAAFRRGNLTLAARGFGEMRASAVRKGESLEWEDDLEAYCPVALALEASYLRERRCLPAALGLQATALILLVGHRPRPLQPRLLAALLIAVAQSLYELGKSEQSMRFLEVCRTLEHHLTHRLHSFLQHNLAVAYLDLGDTSGCRRALWSLERRPHHAVNPARILWTRARLLMTEGDAKGLALLSRVRSEMMAAGTAYDVGLVTLELAHHYASAGNLERARSLALESLPFFASPGCDREALVATGYASLPR